MEDPVTLIKSFANSSNNCQYAVAAGVERPAPISESWYKPSLPRDDVHGYLAEQEVGSFVIRLSNTCKNCYALSIRVPYFANQNGIAHYLITKNSRGFKLKGVEKEFKSLKSLVTHYSVMQGNCCNWFHFSDGFQALILPEMDLINSFVID